ncbi:glycosyltransferase family 39 protein [Hymenobacter saemangeumensis]
MPDFSRSSPLQRWAVPAFFVAVFLLGLLIFRDFGVSIDENQQRDIGMISLKHVAQKIAPNWVEGDYNFVKYQTPLAEFYDRDYGVAFETPVSFLERIFKIADDGDKFLFRHFCTFLVCFGGLIAIFQLARRRFNDWRIGLLAALWMLLTPRLFAESFYNDKDAVFMAMFAIATNTAVRLLLRPTLRRALVHALVCAITIDVRIMGVLLPLATLGLLSWRSFRGELRWAQLGKIVAVYLVVMAGVVVLLWPYLWPAPLHNFVQAFKNMSAFRWGGTVLYRGSMVLATELPWHYAPVWMGITTPILYLVAGLTGIVLVIRQLLRAQWRLWHDEGGLQDLLFLGLFFGPLLAVIVLHSVLYDGWRQLYFIYPAFLLLAIRGWVAAAAWRPRWAGWPRALYAATALSMLIVGAQMVRDHPLQNVYFNLLAGANVGERFEMDYWGLGYRQDLEYIIANEPRSVVKVFAPGPSPAEFNRLMLPADQRGRLQFTDKPEEADYFITNYRWHPESYPYPHEVHQVRADGRRIHSVFRLRW